MKSKKILVVAMALSAAMVAGILGTGLIKAEERNDYPSLVQKLVERFNLNADEVQEVFDEVREEKHQETEIRFEERLNQAIEEGKISQEQKELILAKREEMRQKQEEMKDLSFEERQAAMEKHREEMESWAEENGIDLDLPFLLGPGGPRGHFGPDFSE
jgi:polyhydroxyalkanoate synthesis regulator phasin